MSKDICTMYTKEENIKNGNTYWRYTKSKDTNITPKKYGMFLNSRKGCKKR